MKPEEEWTKMQREFVGSTFEAPKGGVLTVIGVSERKSGSHALFTCECSICSDDKELFPDMFEATKGKLTGGSVPCACTKMDNLTNEQELLIANRFLKENSPNIKAISINKDGREKLFTVECEICSKDTELYPEPFLISKGNLFSGRCPCGCTHRKDLTDGQDLLLVNRYLKSIGSTLTAKEVVRFENKSNRDFILTCEICSKDEELWSYGSIVTTKGQLTSGHIPCACTRTPRWSRSQNTIRAKREATERGFIFHGWSEEYKGKETKVLLENPESGNIWDTTNLNNFLLGGGDPSMNAGGGFDRTKPAIIYLTRFYDGDTPVVIKYGISNKPTKERKNRQERYSGLKGKTVFTYYSEDGRFIENLEKELGNVVGLKRVDRDILPDGFTEAVYYKSFVERFILNYIRMRTYT